MLLEEPSPTKHLWGFPLAGHEAVRFILLHGDGLSLLPVPIRFVLVQWNMTWRAKAHLEAPPRSAGGEEERVSERIKVRGSVGKAYEGAVDELDFDISLCSGPSGLARTDSGMNAATSFWSVGWL